MPNTSEMFPIIGSQTMYKRPNTPTRFAQLSQRLLDYNGNSIWAQIKSATHTIVGRTLFKALGNFEATSSSSQ